MSPNITIGGVEYIYSMACTVILSSFKAEEFGNAG